MSCITAVVILVLKYFYPPKTELFVRRMEHLQKLEAELPELEPEAEAAIEPESQPETEETIEE